ncbi:MAG: ester cyclase [Proteobacteria bacterium]|nr:ester cyclase [Pseudomonadota bacterium]
MDRAALEALGRRWMQLWQGGDLSLFEATHAPDFSDESSAGRGTDCAAFGRGVAQLYRAFPDFTATIEAMVVDETQAMAAIRWRATGTQNGPFLGLVASGAGISFDGIEIIACRGGQVTRRWGHWDEAALLGQMTRRLEP